MRAFAAVLELPHTRYPLRVRIVIQIVNIFLSFYYM